MQEQQADTSFKSEEDDELGNSRVMAALKEAGFVEVSHKTIETTLGLDKEEIVARMANRYLPCMAAHTESELTAGIAEFRDMHKDADVISWPMTIEILSGMKPYA